MNQYFKLGCSGCDDWREVTGEYAQYKSKTGPRQRNHPYEVKQMGAVYGALLNGTSQLAVNRICTMAGLPPMPCRMFHTYKKIIVKCAMDEVEKHLQENVKIIFEEYKKLDIHPDENGILDIEVIYDGTWHTRGYHSTLGAGIVIEVRTGLVIDFIGYSKSCVHCNRKKSKLREVLFLRTKNPNGKLVMRKRVSAIRIIMVHLRGLWNLMLQ